MPEYNETRELHCPKHGTVQEIYLKGLAKFPDHWSGCEECSHEEAERQHEELRKAEEEERRQAWIASKLKSARIPKRFADKSFEDFDVTNPKANSRMNEIRSYAIDIANGEVDRSMILVGKVGNGKTHLGCAALTKIIKSGKTGFYLTFSDLVRSVKESWKKGSDDSESAVYQRFSAPDFVVLDEVGVQNFSEFEQVVAYEAINARYLEEKPTMVITNLPAKELSSVLGERVVDRLREGGGKALDFDWDSYRRK